MFKFLILVSCIFALAFAVPVADKAKEHHATPVVAPALALPGPYGLPGFAYGRNWPGYPAGYLGAGYGTEHAGAYAGYPYGLGYNNWGYGRYFGQY